MKRTKAILQKRFPWLYHVGKELWRSTLSMFTGVPKHQRLFEMIYENNYWGNSESRSGLGSTLANTSVIRRELPKIISNLNAKSLLDLPCGDFHWMKMVDLRGVRYTGGDIVRQLIQKNASLYSSENINFIVCDLLNDTLPKADILLCRDCLPHLPFSDIWKALENIQRSGCVYLLTSTYPTQTENRDIEAGRFRPLNLMLSPFHFPSPLRIFNEGYVDVAHSCPDKSIGLWKISDLPQLH